MRPVCQDLGKVMRLRKGEVWELLGMHRSFFADHKDDLSF